MDFELTILAIGFQKTRQMNDEAKRRAWRLILTAG